MTPSPVVAARASRLSRQAPATSERVPVTSSGNSRYPVTAAARSFPCGGPPWMGGFRLLLSSRRDAVAARSFFLKAKIVTDGAPTEVVSDRAAVYPAVIEDLCPGAVHERRKYATNPVECDHGRLKARLRPMRGLEGADTTTVVVVGHAFIQNIRRGFYGTAPHVPAQLRVKHVLGSLILDAARGSQRALRTVAATVPEDRALPVALATHHDAVMSQSWRSSPSASEMRQPVERSGRHLASLT
jgi:DDE domain